MRSVLYAPAPSSTLLKFLRSQSEAVCFFSPNPGQGSIFDHASQRAPQSKTLSALKSARTTARCISTTVARRATLEAGFLNLDFLFPRSAASTINIQSAQCRTTSRNRGSNDARVLLAHRKASTGSKKWLERLWGATSGKGGRPLRRDDLASLRGREDGGDTVFSLGRAVSAKAAAQPKLRCTELDENGNVVLASGEFKKSELIAKVRLEFAF